jgi:S-formylglutathione hydrolase FrmB
MIGGMGNRGTTRPTRRALLAVLAVAGGLGLLPAQGAQAAPTPSPARLETLTLPSTLVDPRSPGGTMAKGRTAPTVNVLLPAGYDDHPDRAYPVLWLLHGAYGGPDTWLPTVTSLLDGLSAVIVMPDGAKFGMYMDWWNGGHRRGPAWASFHLGQVREEIESRYRIRPDRRWHAIAGISMGGQGALRYAALLPGYFGSVAAFSAALPDMRQLDAQIGLGVVTAGGGVPGVEYGAIYGPADGYYVAGNSPTAIAGNLEHTRVFLRSGSGIHCPQDRVIPASIAIDTLTETAIRFQQETFAEVAERSGAVVDARIECGSHTFGVWDRAIPAARRWGFFEPVTEQPRSWTYDTVATAGEVWGLAFRFSAPPTEVIRMQRSGDRLTVSGRGHLTLDGDHGCRLDLRLPYRGPLPHICTPGT